MKPGPLGQLKQNKNSTEQDLSSGRVRGFFFAVRESFSGLLVAAALRVSHPLLKA